MNDSDYILRPMDRAQSMRRSTTMNNPNIRLQAHQCMWDNAIPADNHVPFVSDFSILLTSLRENERANLKHCQSQHRSRLTTDPAQQVNYIFAHHYLEGGLYNIHPASTARAVAISISGSLKLASRASLPDSFSKRCALSLFGGPGKKDALSGSLHTTTPAAIKPAIAPD